MIDPRQCNHKFKRIGPRKMNQYKCIYCDLYSPGERIPNSLKED